MKINNKEYKMKKITKDNVPYMQIQLPFESNGKNVELRRIYMTEGGDEYFIMPDLVSWEADANHDEFKTLFMRRPVDALAYVFNGYADTVISRPKVFDGLYNTDLDLVPVKFLDKEVGTIIRKRAIKGWNGKVNFKYVVFKAVRNSFSNVEYFLRKDYDKLGLEDAIDFADLSFISWSEVKINGKFKALEYGEVSLPAGEIYATDSESKAEAMIKKVQEEIKAKWRETVSDGSEQREIDDYIWGWRQFIWEEN